MKKKQSEATAKLVWRDVESKPKPRKGPEPERLKITGVKNWEDAVSVALQKPKPPEGWPK